MERQGEVRRAGMGRKPQPAVRRQRVRRALQVESLEARLAMAAFTTGNLLISSAPFNQTPMLYEVTPSGDIVQQTPIPNPTNVVTEVPRDVVVDSQGRAEIFNGTFNPRLTTYDPVANTMSNVQMPYWSTTNSSTSGGLAALNDFVYASDQRVRSEPLTGRGIVRFNTDNLGSAWTKNFDPDIGDSTSNTSTSIPHVTIHGTGDGSVDYYSFTVPTVGAKGIFDIDYGDTGGVGSFQSQIQILDATGNALASSPFSNATSLGQGGSTSTHDAYLEYTFASSGQYLIAVGGCCQLSGVPGGSSYELNMSIQGHTLTVEGGSGVLPESEPNDSIYNPQNTDSADRFFAGDGEPLDVAVGLDGLLYSLLYTGSNSGGGNLINVYDPSTMQKVRTITLGSEHRAIAVDMAGDIYAVGPDISHYDANGLLLNEITNPVGGTLGDIDIKANGCLPNVPSYPCMAVASTNGYVILTDTSLASFDFFAVRPGSGQNFVAFTDPPLSLPQATNDVYHVSENSSGNTLPVLANDLIASGATATITTLTSPTMGGVATIIGGRSIRYAAPAGFAGIETFTYSISDGRGGVSTATVSVDVSNTNQDPTASPDSYQIDEDSVDVVLHVLDNDSTLPDVGETLKITAVGTPDQGGTVVIQGDTLVYTPQPDFAGTETFTYTISDGNGGFATTSVDIDVVNINDPPIAVDDLFAVNPGSADNALDVLANDSTAPDSGESLSIIGVGATAKGGTVVVDNGQTLLYTPPPGPNPNVAFQGTDSFTYTISDGNGGFAVATVTVQVSVVNNPPIATDDNYKIARNSQGNRLLVLGNDTFAPDVGESLTITQISHPGKGESLEVVDNGTAILYSPPPTFLGFQTFTYTVTDGRGGTATATVTLDVGDYNSLPVALDDAFTVRQNTTGNLLDVLTNDFDPDGTDVLGITNGVFGTLNGGLVAVAPDGTGLLYSTPQPFLGTDTFTYEIQDGRGGISQATVTITVVGWQNPDNPLDVNNDGSVSGLDAIILLNQLNGLVTPPIAGADGKLPDPIPNPTYFYDVNLDGYLTAIDALQIVNALNVAGEGEAEGEAPSDDGVVGATLATNSADPVNANALTQVATPTATTLPTGVARDARSTACVLAAANDVLGLATSDEEDANPADALMDLLGEDVAQAWATRW